MWRTRPWVFVVDDDPHACFSLRNVLESHNYGVTTCRSAAEFHGEFEPVHPSCVILDDHLPGMRGEEFMAELRRQQIDIPVIIATASASVDEVVRLMEMGAMGVCAKPLDTGLLLRTVSKALRADAETEQERSRVAAARRLLSGLTPRERQLFSLLVEGKSYKEMAASLGISPRTVEHHRARISVKLGTDRITDMVRLDLCASAERLPVA